eukprot:GEMP01035617.1.p1 GENE.GEMP01035617.1~~GEMP01035617.1.p1  ORF type:complete len:428 (+),score=90.40 GEMP01035617.1:175-1458(+)
MANYVPTIALVKATNEAPEFRKSTELAESTVESSTDLEYSEETQAESKESPANRTTVVINNPSAPRRNSSPTNATSGGMTPNVGVMPQPVRVGPLAGGVQAPMVGLGANLLGIGMPLGQIGMAPGGLLPQKNLAPGGIGFLQRPMPGQQTRQQEPLTKQMLAEQLYTRVSEIQSELAAKVTSHMLTMDCNELVMLLQNVEAFKVKVAEVFKIVDLANNFSKLVCSTTNMEEFAKIPPPDKALATEKWLIWMVHRVYLDDPSLETFDIHNMAMPKPEHEDRIAPKLARAIATNTHVVNMNIAMANLTSSSAKVMAESLKKNTTLHILNVDSNNLDVEATAAFATMLNDNNTLEEIRLNNQLGCGMVNGSPRKVEEELLEALKNNKSITRVGWSFADPHCRNTIDRFILRNNDFKRKRRNEERKASLVQ